MVAALGAAPADAPDAQGGVEPQPAAQAPAAHGGADVGDAQGSEDAGAPAGLEAEEMRICGLDLRVLRRKSDFFQACAGDLPMQSTGLVLWECGVLLADYLGYARWLGAGSGAESGATRPWWMIHEPAPVVPSKFWRAPENAILELGGGCGLVAAVMATLGARVVCTDGDQDALRIAARNCAEARERHCEERRGDWGRVDFCSLKFGNPDAARKVAERGPFGFVVGSDLLYGDTAPPEPLVETLATLAQAPETRGAQVVMAIKNRCADEAAAFCGAARARGLWTVRLAAPDDFLEGYHGKSAFYGSDGGPAYNIVHLTVAEPAAGEEAGPDCKRRRVEEDCPGEPVSA